MTPNKPARATVRTTFAPFATRDNLHDRLSPREIEVLALVTDGLTDREIADRLTLSARTIEAHVASILRKLDVPNRAAATRAYVERMIASGERLGP